MRIIFMGSPQEVIPTLQDLESLCESTEHKLVAIISQAAKPAGRKKQLLDPPVAKYGKEKGYTVLQPLKARAPEFLDELRDLEPDLIITAAYGQILSDDFLKIPKRATINIHPSLLPKYRGATPVQTALYNGDKITGVSILFTVKALDAGNIIAQTTSTVEPLETSQELMPRMFRLGGQMLGECLEKLKDPDYAGTAQDSDQITECHKFSKESGLIDWSLDTATIHNRYRAFQPWPGIYGFHQTKRVLFEQVAPIEMETELNTREFTYVKSLKALVVKTVDGHLRLDQVKPEGSKSLPGAAFWNGLQIKGKGIFDG